MHGRHHRTPSAAANPVPSDAPHWTLSLRATKPMCGIPRGIRAPTRGARVGRFIPLRISPIQPGGRVV